MPSQSTPARAREDDLRSLVEVDAVVWGDELTLDLCEELERLAPFGLGNPGPLLLAPPASSPSSVRSETAATSSSPSTRTGSRSGGDRFRAGSQLDRLRSADR